MATIIATAATLSTIGTRLTGLQNNSARFGFETKRATKKAGPGSDRRMLSLGVKALDQNVAMNLVGEVAATTIDVKDVKWTILATVSQSKSEPLRPQFVLFGSSIVQFSYYEGWGAILSNLYARKADIVLRGYSGWNSRRAVQVLDKIFPKNAIEQPSLVIVYFGGNDATLPNPNGLGSHVPLEEYVENMRKIAIHLKSLSKKTRIIFLSTPPINEAQITNSSDAQGRPLNVKTNEACRIYSEACLKLCREMDIEAIDLWSAIQKRTDWKEVSFLDDGIHLTNEASKIVVREILKVLKEVDWEPSLYWKSMPTEFSEDSTYDPIGSDGKPINISGFFPGLDEWN